jgi:hypothetical protein
MPILCRCKVIAKVPARKCHFAFGAKAKPLVKELNEAKLSKLQRIEPRDPVTIVAVAVIAIDSKVCLVGSAPDQLSGTDRSAQSVLIA